MTRYFSVRDIALWLTSIALIIISAAIFTCPALTFIASLIGVTSLIFCAKGNPVGQVLMIIFSVLYGIISYSFAYYGEMVTYLGMTAPMALLSLISWLKNPYGNGKAEVKVGNIGKKEAAFSLLLTAAVTIIFYFILGALGTANLPISTFSVTTSFLAAYLTFRRIELFALVYAMNDAVLIVMWLMAARTDSSYISVAVCFIVFLINDVYGFVSWRAMRARQKEKTKY